MGMLESDPVIRHFGHQHPLVLTAHREAAPCAGCAVPIRGLAYECKPCAYYLDVPCTQLARHIQHPADPHHALALLPRPAYPEGYFDCNACGHPGTGFAFHCHDCELDIHVLCAVKPLTVEHGGHRHPLALAFASPYPKKGFSCDVCGGPGKDHWLYRCERCEYDAHLGCVQYWDLGDHGSVSGTRGFGSGLDVAKLGRELSKSRLVSSMVEKMAEGAAQQVGQSLMQGFLGSSGSSGLDVGSAIVGNLMGLNN